MSGADLLEDGVAHGTTAGYDAGCRSLGGCPGKDGPWAQTCTAAKSRSRGEFGYGKAVAKGREVEFLEREAEARATRPAQSVPVVKARRAQEKQQGVPLSSDPEVMPATGQAAAEGSVAGFTAERRANMGRGVSEAQERQRAHALATASVEHPLGLALNGEPRKRAAAGTVLFRGRLMLRAAAAAAIAAEVPRRGLTADDLRGRAEAARPVPEARVQSSPVAGVADATVEVERLVRLLADTDWAELTATLRRFADAVETVREFGRRS